MIDLDAMEAAARKRLAEWINRSAAQHLRAMRERPERDLRTELLELRKVLTQ